METDWGSIGIILLVVVGAIVMFGSMFFLIFSTYQERETGKVFCADNGFDGEEDIGYQHFCYSVGSSDVVVATAEIINIEGKWFFKGGN